MLLLIVYLIVIASISKFALERRKNRIRQTKKLRVNNVNVPSDALIDTILPQEIIIDIIKYDLSVVVRCRGVNKYWRSLISDQDLEHLVLHRFEYGRDLLKGVLRDRPRFNNNFHEEPINLTEERIRNVCAAEKSGKFFVEIKNKNLFDELRAIKNETDLLNKFIVQTIGTIIPDLSNENHTYYDRNCILLDSEDEKYYLPRPDLMPLPRLGVGSVKIIFDLGEFLNSDMTNRDHQNTLRVLGWQVFDPIIWTLGIFANEMAVVAPMATLLILPWICSFLTPVLPSWNIYTTIITILGVFLATSNKIHKPILLRQMAATFWLIVTVGSCHWFNTMNIFYVPIYKAIGDLIWTVVFYSYTEFGARFLKNQNLDPTCKIYAIMCIIIAICTSLVVSKSTRDNELSLTAMVLLLWQNIKYLSGTVIYLLMTARIFRINFQETNAYKKLAATYFGSFGSFAAKFGIALVLSLLHNCQFRLL